MTGRGTLPRLREGHAWATNAVLIAAGVALLLLTRQMLIEHDHFVIGFSGVSGWSAVVYLLAVGVVLTQPVNRGTFVIVVGFAVAFHAMAYFSEPFSSSDIYRYVWDGIVQHAHVNPYRYVPGDAALTYLREPNQDVFDNINRRDYARTIYPPVAQMIYWLVTFFSPTVEAMKLAMIGFETVAAAALVALLKRTGRRREQILLFCWCPLLVWEIGLAGHVDAAVIAFISLALLFRCKGQPLWTGVFLGLAILTKFYPAVLIPALYLRRDWKMPTVIAAMTAAGYATYASAGRYVLGFASGYEKEEGMNTGTRYFLLQLAEKTRGLEHLSVHAYMVFCGCVFGALVLWAWRKATLERLPDGRASSVGTPVYVRIAMAFAFAVMLLFSPHYPWYAIWLAPFLALTPNWPIFTYVLGLFYLLTTALGDGTAAKMYMLNERLYGAVGVAFVFGWAMQRWDVWRHFVPMRRQEYGVVDPLD